MWLSDIDYDGEFVSGMLMNSPNWVTSVKQGDKARFAIGEISDWIYAISGEVYGAYTVNLLRSRMDPRERREHDRAWGLNFGDPDTIRTTSTNAHRQLSEDAAASLKEHLETNPESVSAKGYNGWTLLHQAASAGDVPTIRVLLGAGADPTAKTDNGLTALQLAATLGWDEVIELLE
jgi:hypothetical protein